MVIDPHEYANVLGLDGIRYVLESSKESADRFFYHAPLVRSGNAFGNRRRAFHGGRSRALIADDRIAGVAELMNYPGVFLGMESELAKIRAGKGKAIDGHAPGLRGKNLNAYALAGVRSDHESTELEEAREKLRLGMHLLVREGSTERNLEHIIALVTPQNSANCSFATDDKLAGDLVQEGHLDHSIRRAIELGIAPMTAIQMGSINTARHYRLRNHGAIAPRFWADFVVLDDLEKFKSGAFTRKGGWSRKTAAISAKSPRTTPQPRSTMNLRYHAPDDFLVPADGGQQDQSDRDCAEPDHHQASAGRSQVERWPDRLRYRARHPETGRGRAASGDRERRGRLRSGDLVCSAGRSLPPSRTMRTMWWRSERTTRTSSRRFARWRRCAAGRSRSPRGKSKAALPLPIAGLVSDQPLEVVIEKIAALNAAAKSLGCDLPAPFMSLSFLSLSPIPALKLTDQGLVDAVNMKLTSLFEDQEALPRERGE